MSTVEVEDVEYLAERFENMIVGVIEKIEPHPNADRLRVCKVNIGSDEAVVVPTPKPGSSSGGTTGGGETAGAAPGAAFPAAVRPAAPLQQMKSSSLSTCRILKLKTLRLLQTEHITL